MAEALIHVLEMIHVDDKGRDHAVITLTVGDAVAQVIHQQRTVGDARQGIVRDPLHHLVEFVDEIVPEIVEAEFVIGAVGDVGGIGRLALALAETVHDDADRQA